MLRSIGGVKNPSAVAWLLRKALNSNGIGRKLGDIWSCLVAIAGDLQADSPVNKPLKLATELIMNFLLHVVAKR